MSDYSFSLGLALVSLVVLFRKPSKASALAYTALYFTYFSFGPAILYLIGRPIYVGTVPRYIPHAMLGFAIALAGFAIADLIMFRKYREELRRLGARLGQQKTKQVWSSWSYDIGLLICIGFGVIQSYRIVTGSGWGNKLQAIAIAGSFHYPFLLVSSLILCWTLIALRGPRSTRRLLAATWVVYLAYCMITAERDFIFIIFALVIHAYILLPSRRRAMILLSAGVVAVIGGSFIFTWRAGDQLTIDAVLNQGSTLFVDTFVRGWIDSGLEYPDSTYLAALLDASATEYGTLTQWFVVIFTGSASSSAGYGFSLTAEAFMNGGSWGIFAIFLLVGLIQIGLVIKGMRSHVWLILSISFMCQMLYAVRGQASSFISGMTSAVIIAVLVYLGENRFWRSPTGNDAAISASVPLR